MNGMQLIEEAAAAQEAARAEAAAASGERKLSLADLQTGIVPVNKDMPGWKLLDGDGVRSHEVPVVFAVPFYDYPTVRVMLSGFDLLDGANHRLAVFPTKVTKAGFTLVFHTWANTRGWSAAATWMAH